MEHNILLVDDDPGLIRVMARMLAGLGQIRFAQTGEAALQLARDWQPDLMILDAEMPGMSGFQVCEAMKADPSLRDVPIMFVTGHSDHEFEIKGLELGAVDFIAKPVNEALVLARVKTQLRIKRLTDEIRQVATKDLVTKLPNRASFDEVLAKELARAQRSGTATSVLLIEVDHLDLFAERYGFKAMDGCLRQIGATLQVLCDSPADLVARFDQNTFAVLLPDTTHSQGEQRAHQVMDAVERMAIAHDDSPISRHVTTTVGVCACCVDGQHGAISLGLQGGKAKAAADSSDLIRCAKAALTVAKSKGRAQSWLAEMESQAGEMHLQEVSPQSRHASAKLRA